MLDSSVFEPTSLSKSGLSKSKLKRLKRKNLISEEQFNQLVPLAQINKGPTFRLEPIKPRTINQNRIFKAFNSGQHLMVHGYPGTGKTFVVLGIALNEVLNNNTYEKVVIVRSTVPTRDMGFMPGNRDEKESHYETPYVSICNELFGRCDAYDNLKRKGLIEFCSTSFLRGLTLRNAIVIFDECENGTFHELDTVITRMGDNSRAIFVGDFKQSDLRFKDERQGLLDFMHVIRKMSEFTSVEMGVDDIIRSGMVRNYIIHKVEAGF